MIVCPRAISDTPVVVCLVFDRARAFNLKALKNEKRRDKAFADAGRRGRLDGMTVARVKAKLAA
jgi:hypothetical protein